MQKPVQLKSLLVYYRTKRYIQIEKQQSRICHSPMHCMILPANLSSNGFLSNCAYVIARRHISQVFFWMSFSFVSEFYFSLRCKNQVKRRVQHWSGTLTSQIGFFVDLSLLWNIFWSKLSLLFSVSWQADLVYDDLPFRIGFCKD